MFWAECRSPRSALGGTQQPGHQVHERGLPGSVGADQAGDARRNRQAHAIDAQHFAVEPRDVLVNDEPALSTSRSSHYLRAADFPRQHVNADQDNRRSAVQQYAKWESPGPWASGRTRRRWWSCSSPRKAAPRSSPPGSSGSPRCPQCVRCTALTVAAKAGGDEEQHEHQRARGGLPLHPRRERQRQQREQHESRSTSRRKCPEASRALSAIQLQPSR